MKKLLTLMLALAFSMGLKAQCHITEAVDFTATDIYGREVHLFDILDNGQYVLIDFFFTTCSGCIQTIPYVEQAYHALGCNMHDVFFMEIDQGDSEAACVNWATNYGVEYPTISGVAGGTNICIQYGISMFPTCILIAPDRQIVIQDLWPISNVQSIINALQPYGIEQHDCNAPALDPQVSISIDLVMETEVTATFTPNAECASYAYTIATEAEIQEWMAIAGLELPEYLWNYGIPGSDILSNTFSDLTPNTEYIIFAVPADIDGNLGDVVREPVTTTPGGTTEIMEDFTGIDIEGNEIHLYDILDAGQAVFINFFLAGDPFSETPMPDVLEAYRLYGCNEHDVFFMEICPNAGDATCQAWVEGFNVQYPTISRDGGGNDIVQAIPVALYPGFMLIRPDHTIAKREVYPPTLEYFVRAMDDESYEQHECPYDETLTFSMNTVNLNYCEMAYITIYNNSAEDATITSICDERYELDFTFDGQEMFSCYFPMEYTIPQGESVELGIVCCVTGKAIVPNLVTISSNLPDAQFVVMVDDTWSVDENEASATLFPNPANDFVTLSGESLGIVRVYNALGQKVDEFEANSSELRINTMGYENGVYFIKTNGQAIKFVVRH